MKAVAAVLLVVVCTPSLFAAPGALRKIEPHEVTAAEISAQSRDGHHIVLRTASFDPATERPDFQSVGLPRTTQTEYAIVQFEAGRTDAKTELEQQGVKFFGYLPDNAYEVRMSAGVRARIASNPAVRWIGDFEPGFKVHPRLWPARGESVRNVRIVSFADASVAKLATLIQRAVPGTSIAKMFNDEHAHWVELSVPAGSLGELVRSAATLEGVAWIEPGDPLRFHNSNSSGAIQGNQLGTPGRTIFAHNITGTGQIIAVADSGLDSDMCFFRTFNGVDAVTDASIATTAEPGPLFPQNKVIGYWVQEGAAAYDSTGAAFHGTHTSGSVAGDNGAHPSSATDAGVDPGDGMAPNAQILFQDIGDATGELGGGNPYFMFLQALRGGARVHSNSYGSETKGAYTAYDQLVDQFVFDHDEMTIFFSSGNEGPGASTTGSPGNAKNVITVGATGAGTSTFLTGFSSRGPTTDGRIKPDVLAPGQGIVSAGGDDLHTSNNCLLASKQGTSMAAPTAAGGGALVRQYFADGFYPTGSKNSADKINPSAPLVKATILNGTLPLPVNGEFGGFSNGWGKMFLDNNLYFPGDARKLRVWDLPNAQGLVTGESATYTVSAAAGQELRATLVWTDPEGSLGSGKALVNDLDLVVTNGADTFAGNVFSAAGASITGGNADRTNNVEQVRVPSPAGGTYSVTVRATNVPGNGRSGTNKQGYALVVSASSCTAAVSAAPQNLHVTTNTTRGADLAWSAIPGATVTQIYRATGANPNPGDFRYIGSSSGTTFTDRRAQGGYTYTYSVRGADDCGEGPSSNAVPFTAQGLCDIAPSFAGVTSAQADGTNCRINVSWAGAQSNCPLGNTIRYNIYRSTSPDFTPAGTPYATTSGTAFSDIDVVSGTTYYYIVRAEDSTAAANGPHGGNQESNTVRLFATAFGSPAATGTWRDGAGDGGAYLSPESVWRISSAEAKSGTHSYHNAPDHDRYTNDTCASLVTPPIALDANAELAYAARFNLEYQWDGVIVEISADGGATWTDLPPAGGYPSTLAETQGENGTDAPVNACGYPKTAGAFTGPQGNASLTPWTDYHSSLAAFSGKTVRIRWRFTSDPGSEFEGFYLDDVTISNAKLPGPCVSIVQVPVASFEVLPGNPGRGVRATFADTSQNKPAAWLWEFGDGATSTEQNPTHIYLSNGTFTVKLTVTNEAGTNQATKSILVQDPIKGAHRRSVRN